MGADAVSLLNHLNLKNEMSKQKAFVRYTKNGQIVPGSLVLSYNYPKPGLWAEVITDICCDTDIPGTITTTPKAWVRYTKEGKIVPGSLVVGNSYPNSGIWKEVIIDVCCKQHCSGEVQIGEQIWTKCNLNTNRYLNGDLIPEVTDPVEWANLTTGAWCYYNNDPANGAIYGKLYNWYAVNDPRGLGVSGYHIPSESEWVSLADYLGGEDFSGTKMKSTSGWYKNGNGNNSSGFSGLPGGRRSSNGPFNGIGEFGFWWSSTGFNPDYAWARYLPYSNGTVDSSNDGKAAGFSVRCLRD